MRQKKLSVNYVDPKTKHSFCLPVDLFKRPKNENEYSNIEKVLDRLIDEVRGDENHPLSTVMQIIGDNLEEYDNSHYPQIDEGVSDIDFVKYLMNIHDLNQKDLSDVFGNQANVSKFLNGERSLSKSQIAGLKKRFGISTDIFFK